MIQDRVCRECSRSFEGGPRAYYCHDCRAERKKKASRECKARERAGTTRKIGSIDRCERCGKEYQIKGSLQRFCADCKPIHTLEYDRQTSLPFYHANKDRINPERNLKRRKRGNTCAWCGNVFNPVNGNTTCSNECKRLLGNKRTRECYKRKKIDQYKIDRHSGKVCEGAIRMIVARWNTQAGITLKQMQDWKSTDYAHGIVYRHLDGVSASTSASYLLHLIIRSIFNDNGNLRAAYRSKKALGEIVIVEAEDTGARCMDNQPVVKPVKIIDRFPVYEFLNLSYLKDENASPLGPRFQEIAKLLDAEHHQELVYNDYMKKYGYKPFIEDII